MVDQATKNVIQHGIDLIDELKGQEIEASELHHHLYNEDYFIIGTRRAEEFLDQYGIFNAINEIKDYEQDNFGEVTTDLSNPERVANMFAYIKGEEALNSCIRLSNVYDLKLSDNDLDVIKEQLEAQL